MGSNVVRPGVDERDTQWEADFFDARVFLFRTDGVHEVVDIDRTTLSDVEGWIQENNVSGAPSAIAIRWADDAGRPGLIWVRPQQ